ncbi:MFS transporter [Acidianus manzaensis]|uniref:MFS transporter n=1 Tax=Acidianus manzaensis TaxID=282676 RepID=A0A1W6JX62_9CREN|nr:MFS transporter [Acidianus manzaensis]ARM74822.1 MFS transporter [Acidianus manzaensis]
MDFEKLPGRLRAFFLSSGGFLLDGYDLSVISFAVPFISKGFNLNASQTGLITSSSLIGMLIGSLIFGFLSDKIGRKKLMSIDLIFFSVFALTSGISSNFYELFISRLLLGIGIGGDYPISSTLTSEYSPSNDRGKYLVGTVSMYWIGTLVSALANLSFLPLGDEFWRYSFILGSILSLPIIIGRIRLSESPRWLISKGLLSGNKIPSKEEENRDVRGILDLFEKKNLLYLVISTSLVWFLFDVASYGIGLYYPYILHEFAFPSNYEVIYGTIAISIGAIIGYAIAISIIDSAGRRTVLLLGLASMGIILLLGGLIKISGFSLVPYFMIFVAMEQWAGAVTLFYPTEIFPTPVRSTAQGFATAVSRIGAILGVYFFPTLVDILGFSSSLIFFSISSFIALGISFVIVKETKRKSLEEISASQKV